MAMCLYLPGASISGVVGVALQPWLDRRHDATLGFGRRLSQAVLVRMHGRSEQASCFLPCGSGEAVGCWRAVI